MVTILQVYMVSMYKLWPNCFFIQLYPEAAALYEKAHSWDKAASVHIKSKNWSVKLIASNRNNQHCQIELWLYTLIDSVSIRMFSWEVEGKNPLYLCTLNRHTPLTDDMSCQHPRTDYPTPYNNMWEYILTGGYTVILPPPPPPVYT